MIDDDTLDETELIDETLENDNNDKTLQDAICNNGDINDNGDEVVIVTTFSVICEE